MHCQFPRVRGLLARTTRSRRLPTLSSGSAQQPVSAIICSWECAARGRRTGFVRDDLMKRHVCMELFFAVWFVFPRAERRSSLTSIARLCSASHYIVSRADSSPAASVGIRQKHAVLLKFSRTASSKCPSFQPIKSSILSACAHIALVYYFSRSQYRPMRCVDV